MTLAWATTIHKVQGLTLDEIVVDMKGGRFNNGQAYVAFSRVKTMQGLHIVNFTASAIKSSSKVQEEMDRLNTKLLPPLAQLQCFSLTDSHITIALLNVRSLNAKLPDILSDNNMACASILCFCETWLSESHAPLQIFNHHTILRCDRQSDNNKGGVLMSIDPHIKVTNTSTFCIGNCIEGIVTKLMFPNASEVRLVLIYRSPSSPLNALVSNLSTIISQLSMSTLPILIMGDFNVDLLCDSTNNTLLQMMLTNGFTQLVNSPTNDSGPY